MRSIMSWLLTDDCPVTYDDWSDEYMWSCAMRVDGRYSTTKVTDEVGHAVNRHHSNHHDTHLVQTQDWCVGVRKNDRGIIETICSHEVEEDPERFMPNDWQVI